MVKVQGHQAALITAVLTRQAAATVSVGTIGRGNLLLRCGLHSAGSAARGASAPTEGGEGRGMPSLSVVHQWSYNADYLFAKSMYKFKKK